MQTKPPSKRPERASTDNHQSIGKILAAMKAGETYDLPANWKTRKWQLLCEAEFRKKHRLCSSSFYAFVIAAGTGAGKTIMAAMIASYLLNRGDIDRVVYVCPNKVICGRVIDDFKSLNIDLVRWSRKRHGGGETPGSNGIVLTYQALIRDSEIQGSLCDDSRTLVIFDEIHHLGNDLSWGDKAEAAFKNRAKMVLGLSGTPFRGDNRVIPFVKYEVVETEGLRRFDADYTYTLGRAILDGVCRRPVFHLLHGDVRIKFPDGHREVVNFERELPVPLMNRRLNGAVRAGSMSRAIALRTTVEFCRRNQLKLIIFVGGDSSRKDGGGVTDATECLPAELRALGITPNEYRFVTSECDDPQGKIKHFGKSDAWILIAVNMVSEGVDIPELSAALLLTSITALATTIQRIGRVLRGEGEAHIFVFADARYIEIARLIESERRHEIELGKESFAPAPAGPGGTKGEEPEPVSIGLTCQEGGLVLNGVHHSPAVRKKYYQVISDYSLPEGQAFMSVIVPMIIKGAYGPLEGDATESRPQ